MNEQKKKKPVECIPHITEGFRRAREPERFGKHPKGFGFTVAILAVKSTRMKSE